MSPGPNEALRFERLRAQDGSPMLPPPSLQPLCRGGGLDPAHVGEAMRMWQAAQDELRSMPSYPAEERLFWTALLLARHYTEQGQRPQAPVFIEPALPMLQQARHQQILLGLSARNAAAMGDLDGAMRILPRLDASSEDLQVDTNYRFTTAYVALLRNDPRTALSVLGSHVDDVPISDAFDLVCGVFRAHAHEQLGNLELAQQQLQRLAPSPEHLAAVKSIAEANPELPLVRQSLPALEQAVAQLHENPIVTDSGVKLGRMLAISLFAPLITLAIVGFATEYLDLPIDDRAPGAIIVAIALGGVAFSIRGAGKPAAQRKRVLEHGVEGVGQLMVVEQTGIRVNSQPMLRLRMIVTLPGEAPYSVVHKEVVPEIRLAQVQPGTTLRVRVDPVDPKQMAVAWE